MTANFIYLSRSFASASHHFAGQPSCICLPAVDFATKYFYALEDGEVPLLFLFSGTVFYDAPDGRLQIQKIPWEKECAWRMPIARWQELMEHHYPDSAWIAMRRDVFDQLYEFKRREGLSSWDEVLERLLTPNGSVAS